MFRQASTVASNNSGDETLPDPNEEDRMAREEVCISARFLMTKTDGRTA